MISVPFLEHYELYVGILSSEKLTVKLQHISVHQRSILHNKTFTMVYIKAVLATRDDSIITIFPAGNDIDLKHILMIMIFNIFFKF